jgi:hypothetical protein
MEHHDDFVLFVVYQYVVIVGFYFADDVTGPGYLVAEPNQSIGDFYGFDLTVFFANTG